jgi:tetratricopeptide (TPR) repeat protein
MGQTPDRIDGWKAIAAHFRRDRTTVMRWARDRELPVHRVPGGGSSSVYALKSELDAWLADHPKTDTEDDSASDDSMPPAVDASAPETSAPPLNAPSQKSGLHAKRLVPLGIAVALIASLVFVASPHHTVSTALPASRTEMLPANPQVAALYLQARDDWAERTSAGLNRAVDGFGKVVSRDPNFAPAYTGLADAYLLVREYDALSDAEAYPRAKAAAQAALAIQPDSHDAARALGFIQYWWENDPEAAGLSFRKAIASGPDDAQNHHWYGNILADNGNTPAALRELNRARLLEPGSLAVQSDLGWAMWAAGDTAGAVKLLEQLRDRRPDFISPRTYLARIYLGQGDYAGYLREESMRAKLREEPVSQKRMAAEQAAFNAGGAPALLQLLMADARSSIETSKASHQWLAFLTSVSGDRAGTVAALTAAEQAGETWGTAGLTRHIARSWPKDRAIAALLARHTPEPVEPVALVPR